MIKSSCLVCIGSMPSTTKNKGSIAKHGIMPGMKAQVLFVISTFPRSGQKGWANLRSAWATE